MLVHVNASILKVHEGSAVMNNKIHPLKVTNSLCPFTVMHFPFVCAIILCLSPLDCGFCCLFSTPLSP